MIKLSLVRKIGSFVGGAGTAGPSKKGSWRDNLRTSPYTSRYSPEELVSRPIPANLVARPVVAVLQLYETVVDVLTAPPGKRPTQLVNAVSKGVRERIDFNKAFIEGTVSMVKGVG